MKGVIAIVGPTAVGKSRFAAQVAERFGLEIINTDSVQMYRHFDIGSDKPRPEVRLRAQHHGFDLVEPTDRISAGRFARIADDIIESRPCNDFLAVGGCGLYQRALLFGLTAAPPSDEGLRSKIEARFSTCPEKMYEELLRLLPKDAVRIHPNDRVRTMRALIVYEMTGKSMSEWHSTPTARKYRILKVGLSDERHGIYQRIDERIDRMVEAGLLAEIEGLIERRFDESCEPARSIGYRYFYEAIRGKISFAEAMYLTKRESRHYAKRQLTWFRNEKEISWFEPHEWNRAEERIERFISDCAA